MVKHSPEHRAGQLYKIGANLPQPPPELHEPEAKLWQTIIASKPPDWFEPATLRLLMRYVRTAVYAEELHDLLDAQPIGGPHSGEFLKQIIALNASLGSLAARMRLSTQVTVSARSTGQMAQTGSVRALDIGGPAVHGKP